MTGQRTKALLQTLLPVALLSLLAGGAAGATETPFNGVAGRVLGESTPLPAAGVYAFQLADSSLRKALTDARGTFHFPELPAGLYKIIAFKKGFAPVVVLLSRTAAQAYQYVDVQLASARDVANKGDDFWSIRARVPADVLHQIEAEELTRMASVPSGQGNRIDRAALAANGFETEMRALTGVGDVPSLGSSQLTGGGVGIRGQLGDVQVGLKGQFLQLSGASATGLANLGSGRSSSLSLDLAHGPRSRVNISSFNNSLTPRSESGDRPIDFERYTVNWSQEVGQNGRSDFAAHYIAENNFHSRAQASFEPWDVPDFSRAWRVEGAYTAQFSDRNSLQAGIRYREREYGLNRPGRVGKAFENQAFSSVDLYSRGGLGVAPAVLVEYGMFSTLSDGTVSLAPQGGMVLQLGSNWQLHGSAIQRVYASDSSIHPDFLPTLFDQSELCEQGSASCYELKLARKGGNDDELSLSALKRVVGNTLRLYFSEDFLDRDQSLYLVQGDELPELRVGFQHKISPGILTKLDSSIASGGGGQFVNPQGRLYENQIRYLTASLDTQILDSSTGIFLSFRRLEQELDPVGARRAFLPKSAVQYDRLQLMLSQSLNSLIDMASEWVLQVNMELTRNRSNGGDATPDEHQGRRILGGIAVKF